MGTAAGGLDSENLTEKHVEDLLKAATNLMQASNQLTAVANAYLERLDDLKYALRSKNGEHGTEMTKGGDEAVYLCGVMT